MHAFPGLSGVTVGILTPCVIWWPRLRLRAKSNYLLDAAGVRGAFEPFLTKYLKLAEILIGLATGSIVLLVSSSALGGRTGRLPSAYASPLYLLAFSVMYAVAFSVWLTFHYEDYQHDGVHSRVHYALSETLGFAALTCFLSGYGWLIFRVTG